MNDAAHAILAYLQAKDENRPYLISAAFREDARVSMTVRTTSIAFPSEIRGSADIADVLVRRFNQKHENIHSFCLGPPPALGQVRYSCAWLVAMSQKQDGAVRFGAGRYDWAFDGGGDRRASALTIRVDLMETLGEDMLPTVMTWAGALPRPWCESAMLERRLPELPVLRGVLQHARDIADSIASVAA